MSCCAEGLSSSEVWNILIEMLRPVEGEWDGGVGFGRMADWYALCDGGFE